MHSLKRTTKLITRKFPLSLAALALCCGSATASPVVEDIDWPAMLADHDLVWGSVPDKWFRAPFFGNGEQGTLMYKIDNRTIRWDVGCSAAHDHRSVDDDDLSEKVPEVLNRGRHFIGHLRLNLPADLTGCQARLNLWDAEASGTFSSSGGSVNWTTLVHATAPVMRFEITGSGNLAGADFTYVAEEARGAREIRSNLPRSPVNPPPVLATLPDGVRTAVHNLYAGGQTAVAYLKQDVGGSKRLWLGVRHSFPGSTAETEAVAAVRAAAAAGQTAWVQAHRDWWHAYYPASFVSTGDAYWDPFYWIQQYKRACATRDQGWIIDNQGPWLQPTAWNSCWWNLNVQLSHSGANEANRREMVSALSHRLDINRANLARNVAEAYRADSYAIGRASSGWDLFSHAGQPGGRPPMDGSLGQETGNLLWALHNIDLEYRHWLDTGLRDNVLYPLLVKAVNYYRHFLVQEGDGLLHLPSTYSPEYTSAQDCSYDISLLRWASDRLVELAAERGMTPATEPLIPVWTDIRTRLVPLHVDATGIMIGRNVPLSSRHRHWSHLLAIYPLRTLTPLTQADRDLIQLSLDHWQSFGAASGAYSLTGGSCMASLLGDGDRALGFLDQLKPYLQASTMYTELSTLPVIETPLHGATAMQEMLLQSWGGRLRIFPAVATAWTDVQFHLLRGEGAYLVSARREAGQTKWACIEATVGGTVEVDPRITAAQWTASPGATVSTVSAGIYQITASPGNWVLFWPAGVPQPEPHVTPVARRGTLHRFGLPTGYDEDDISPPSPDPVSFSTPPAALDATTITMAVTPASDLSGPVQDFFENLTNGNNSGWTTSTSWSNSGLTTGQQYDFRVRARDAIPNTGSWSASASAVPAADTTAPTPNPMGWAVPPAAVSTTAITMTATTASDPAGVQYHFTNLTFPNGSHDSGWQDSPVFLDTGLSPGTTYSYQVSARDKSANANPTAASTPPASAATDAVQGDAVLFADTFDRADALVLNVGGGSTNGDINGTHAGKSGMLANLTWTTRAFSGDTFGIQSNALTSIGTGGANTNGGLAYINDHNFTDAAIVAGGGFSITVDIVSYQTGGSGRRWGIGVGQTLADLDALTADAAVNTLPGSTAADLIVAYRNTTDDLEIYKNGTLISGETILSGLPDPPTTMRIDFTLSSFNAGSPVNYAVYFDSSPTPLTSGTFTWSGTNENHISIANNLTGTSKLDNFVVRANAPPPSDYENWSANFPTVDLTDPDGDFDRDGLTNNEERIWGLDPTSGESVRPVTVPLDAAAGTFSYTRRDPALTELTFEICISENLADWEIVSEALQTSSGPDANGVETVAVQIRPSSLLAAPRLFVQVRALR